MQLEHSEMFVPPSENGASETRMFLMNIVLVRFSCSPTFPFEVGQHSLLLADARCYEHGIVSEAKMVQWPNVDHHSHFRITCCLSLELLDRVPAASPFAPVACQNAPMDSPRSMRHEERHIDRSGFSWNPTNTLVGVPVFS
ncbi:unnamed protein product [Heligmosomoides polygyrus]|uniref:Uncharacterized protein n=1 Tax=Heligmosomoides polygyrus TaxID=6339 RepID=A0A183F3D5_HELPZ|nr:unnamed protein product [Heligmosomoides polygyrus]